MVSSTDWWPDWSGRICVIVAAGPSAKASPLEIVKGRAKVLVINSSWRLAPWADVLYACDFKWWHQNRGVPEFKGLKVSQDFRCPRTYKDVRHVECERGIERKAVIHFERRGLIGWGGNGGFQALNLAILFGSKHIILVGYDMRIDKGVHWHGKHPSGLNNPQEYHMKQWVKCFDSAAPSLKEHGVEVINASPVSALAAYPKMSLAEALDGTRTDHAACGIPGDIGGGEGAAAHRS